MGIHVSQVIRMIPAYFGVFETGMSWSWRWPCSRSISWNGDFVVSRPRPKCSYSWSRSNDLSIYVTWWQMTKQTVPLTHFFGIASSGMSKSWSLSLNCSIGWDGYDCRSASWSNGIVWSAGWIRDWFRAYLVRWFATPFTKEKETTYQEHGRFQTFVQHHGPGHGQGLILIRQRLGRFHGEGTLRLGRSHGKRVLIEQASEMLKTPFASSKIRKGIGGESYSWWGNFQRSKYAWWTCRSLWNGQTVSFSWSSGDIESKLRDYEWKFLYRILFGWRVLG